MFAKPWNDYYSHSFASQITPSDKLKVSLPEYRIFNGVVLGISVVQRETTLTISDSMETGTPVKFELVRVVSPSTKIGCKLVGCTGV